MACLGVCVKEDWFKQPCMAKSDWTLWLGEAAHRCVLCIE